MGRTRIHSPSPFGFTAKLTVLKRLQSPLCEFGLDQVPDHS
jgi:hypothetical protein